MRGNLESTEAIATRMESNSESKKPLASTEEDEDTTSDENNEIVESPLDLDKKLAKALEEENEKDLKREKLALDEDNKDYKNEKLALSEEEKELKSSDKNLRLDEADEDFTEKKSAELDLEDESNQRALAKKKEDKDLNRRDIDNSKLDIDGKKEKDIHEGKTDKISTYYKSGESKDKEHDWDIGDKTKNTQLEITKTKKQEVSIDSTKKAHGPEETIDYRKLKEEFDMISRGESTSDGSIEGSANGGLQKNYNSEESFKVVELGPVSFDFSIEILNLIYSPDIKPAVIFKTVAEKLLQDEKAYMVSYTYKLSDKKFTENFNSYTEFPTNVTEEIKTTWESIKNDPINTELFVNISMPTWMCRSIPENDTFWRDLDLPQWASKELTDKPVELVYPFFDGVDRMGYVHILFPSGINPTNEKKINIVIEMLRSVFLDTVQRKSSSKSNDSRDESLEEQTSDSKKGNVLNFFGNIFGKKKAG
jgi:hypothetical protein